MEAPLKEGASKRRHNQAPPFYGRDGVDLGPRVGHGICLH
jgi:hypothetical protein